MRAGVTTVDQNASVTVTHLVVDYGQVICTEQPVPDVDALVAALRAVNGADETRARLLDRYWQFRLAYDRGDLGDREYWSLVTAASPTPEQADELVRLDLAGWSHLRPESVAALSEFAGRGVPMALLSNTSEQHAAWMSAQPWASSFAVHVFSCRLRVVKPDEAIFRHTVAALGCAPSDAAMVDDRAENVAGARAVGMLGVHFTGPQAWDEVRALLR